MKKRLLLTLLPLAFLVAACSGAQEGIQSSSAAQSSAAGTSSTAGTSSAAGDTSSAAGDNSSAAQDIRAQETPVAEGYCVKIGNFYYELEEQTTDKGRKASYNVKNIEFEEGQKVAAYVNGEQVSVWAEADKANGVYPNYDERPQTSQYDEFTITEGETGDIYFHVNSDDSYSIWITPAQSGGGSGGEGGGSGSGGGSEPSTSECVWYVCGKGAFLEGGQEWGAGGKQMSAHGDNEVMITLTFSVGDQFKIVQKVDLNPSEAGDQYRWIGTWHTKITGEGCKGAEFGATANPSKDDNLICTEAGTYDIYVVTSEPWNVANDHILIQAHTAA